MRVVLFVGGASSGKSLIAEQCAERLGTNRLYVATLTARDAESAAKIGAHRARRGASWRTVDTGADLARCLDACPECDVVLVDSAGVWVAGLICGVYASTDISAYTVDTYLDNLVRAVRASRRPVVLVSDEVGMGLVPADRASRTFRDVLGAVNRRLAEVADHVFFVSCGLPLRLKGQEDVSGLVT